MATTEIETRILQLEEVLSERISRLEEQLSSLARQIQPAPEPSEAPWWKKIVGIYEGDPEFEEAMRLGREYRESLRPPDNGSE